MEDWELAFQQLIYRFYSDELVNMSNEDLIFLRTYVGRELSRRAEDASTS